MGRGLRIGFGPAFSSTFTGSDESPLSEGGAWAKAANSWQALRRASGVAKPAAYTENYDDAYSLYQARTYVDVEVIATIFRQNATFGEVEILVRASDTAGSPGTAAAYEFLLNTDGNVDIVRWEGALTSFLSILGSSSSPGSVANGDQIRATVIGTALRFYWRRPGSSMTWTLIGSSDGDTTYASGKVGLSFYVHAVGGNIDDLGFTDVTVTPL